MNVRDEPRHGLGVKDEPARFHDWWPMIFGIKQNILRKLRGEGFAA